MNTNEMLNAVKLAALVDVLPEVMTELITEYFPGVRWAEEA